MDEALVQDPQDEIDHEHREEEQEEKPLLAGLEDLGRSVEARRDALRQGRARDALDLADRLSQGGPGTRVERDGHGRNLSHVIDAERPDRRSQAGHGAQGNQGAGARRDVEILEGRDVALELGLELHDDPVLIG